MSNETRCPQCRHAVTIGFRTCQWCGYVNGQPVKAVSLGVSSVPSGRALLSPGEAGAPRVRSLTCDKCAGAMVQAKVRRFSPGLVLIGHLLLIPAFLIMAGVTSCATLTSGAAVSTLADPSEFAASTIAAGISWMFVAFVGIFMIPTFIIGLVLVLNRKVWRCGRCGYVFDRA